MPEQKEGFVKQKDELIQEIMEKRSLMRKE